MTIQGKGMCPFCHENRILYRADYPGGHVKACSVCIRRIEAGVNPGKEGKDA